MSVPNQVYPNTRAEDERLVRRGQGSFRLGLIKDVDPMDLPNDAVADLVNMRATSTGLSGRPGSFLWSPLELPNIYDASTSSVTLYRGDDVVSSDLPFFLPEYVNYKIRTSDNRVFFINEYVNPLTVKVKGADVTGIETLTDSKIVAPINASYVDNMTGDTYYLVGTRLVGRKRGENEWLEYTIASGSKPYSSASSFHRIEDSIVLMNQSGIYWLSNIEGFRYAIKMNTPLPEFKLNRSVFGSNVNLPVPSTYKYAYGYTLFEDVYNQSRYSGDPFIIRETPGKLQTTEDSDDDTIFPTYLPDGKGTDTTLVTFERPIGSYRYRILEIRDGISGTIDPFKGLYENGEKPMLIIRYNSVNYEVFFNFSNIKTLVDVADVMQESFRESLSYKINVHLHKIDRPAFEIYSSDSADSILFSLSPSSNGRNMLYNMPITGSTLVDKLSFYNKAIIKYLRAPDSSIPITSYSIYRSTDIQPHTEVPADLNDKRIANNPNLMALIDDTPACKIFTGTISTSIGTYVTSDSLDATDIGNTLTYLNDSDVWTTTSIIDYGGFDNVLRVSDLADDATDKPMYFGAGTAREISQTGDTITVITGDGFSADDVGLLIYWEDGTYDIITEYDVITFKIKVGRQIERTSEWCLMYPTDRVYNDVTDDATLEDAYLPFFPYDTRFFSPMPNTNVSSHTGGYVLSAIRDKSTLYYSQTDELSRIGYYRSINQVNTSLDEGIKSITNTGGYFTVCTLNNTYLINPGQANDAGDPDFGESFFVLPNPILTASGIGSTHQSKWANGMDAGLVAITNEPAVRFFDGVNYGPDLSDGYIRRAELQKMDSLMLLGYDHNSGLFVWGRGV